MDAVGSDYSMSACLLKKTFRDKIRKTTLYDVLFGTGKAYLLPDPPWLYVFNGKDTLQVEVDVYCCTVADLFVEVTRCYGLQVTPKVHLRIVFTDKELKFSNRKRLSDYDVINHSTIGVIFRLPDAFPFAESLQVESWNRMAGTSLRTENGTQRPTLRRLEGFIELTNNSPDLLDFEIRHDLYRAVMPCGHVIGSNSLMLYLKSLLARGGTRVPCPYYHIPFTFIPCPTEWIYRLVRHVACFTTEEMHDVEKTMAINHVGKDQITFNCPGCFTWCSRMNSKTSRLFCFLCTKTTGKNFLFCKHCLGEWKSSPDGTCGNPGCNSPEARLEILRNCQVTQLYGGTWPTIRACPRCGILIEFLGQCSQMHCQSCGHYFCFLCLKGAKSKMELKCVPYDSDCQRAPLQTTIAEWDGHSSE